MPDADAEEIVIVAENDTMMRGLLRSFLNKPGRTVLLCADGREALLLASQITATLIFLDMRMPRMDGLEACRRIRGLPRGATVPIIIASVFDGEGSQKLAMQAGATAFLGKPFSVNQLSRAVTPLIEARKGESAVLRA